MNTNFSLRFDPTGNGARVYRFSSRRSATRALIGSIALLDAVSKAEPESKKLFLFSCNTKSFAHLIYCLTSLIMLLETDNQFWVTR